MVILQLSYKKLALYLLLFLSHQAFAAQLPAQAAATSNKRSLQPVLIPIESKTGEKLTMFFLPGKKLEKQQFSGLKSQIEEIIMQEPNARGLFDFTNSYESFCKRSSCVKQMIFAPNDQQVAILQKSNHIVGALFFSEEQNELDIRWFAIDQKKQKKGYGQILLQQLLASFPNHRVTLSCFLSNKQAQNFYLKNGFTLKKPTEPDANYVKMLKDALCLPKE
ncbi:MAG: hypothetical protein UV79_C0010G0005 [candidate division TM6 bacterium GW2011_GWF2_43_17]|nr:MAG: hypothetical protein UV79_C0010G0005 [candidate division TM6 bacterium GW2011_GWF2_43_17]HAU30440.1 hypothetical protein [Candidatus Dependentiae bacterium]